MAVVTRSSRLAIMQETTEGTAVVVSGASDFVALQEGFEMSPTVETIENAELKGSIGATKKVLGLEGVEASFSHYLTHSGTQGQAPEYNLVLKSLLGAENVQSTERTTTTSSTAGTSSARATVILGAGGSDYSAINSGKGTAILLKDTTNGYSIRNVYSVSSNTLTLAQNLSAAPATGMNCGKFVNYSPADSSHPSLSFWLYRANGGAVELGRGVKIAEGTIEATAGENINFSFSGSGVGYDFNPLVVTASNNKLNITTDAVTDAVVTLTNAVYNNPDALAAEIQAKADAAAGGSEVITCVYSDSTGKFTIAASGTATLSLLWKTGTNGSDNTDTHVGTLIGFSDAADDTGALTYTSDNAITLTSPYTPSYDNAQPLVAKDIEVMVGGFNDISCFCVQSFSVSIANEKQNIPCACEDTGIAGSLMTGRAVTGNFVFSLSAYDIDKFYRYKNASETMVTINAGSKTSGNWDAGKCVNVWVARATLDTHVVGDTDGIVTVSCDFSGYVENSEGEIFINFL